MSQEQENEKDEDDDELQISIGYGIYSNSLNDNMYYEYKDSWYDNLDNLEAFTLKFTLPTKKEYLDVFFGARFVKDLLTDGPNGFVPGRTNATKHILNGGGVFAGLSPKWKGEHFGLTSEFGVGVFSFKEVYSHFNNVDEPFVDIHEKKTTYGLGAVSSVGFYVKFGWFGINPNINMLFTGGNNASFLLYGVSLPLTIYL